MSRFPVSLASSCTMAVLPQPAWRHDKGVGNARTIQGQNRGGVWKFLVEGHTVRVGVSLRVRNSVVRIRTRPAQEQHAQGAHRECQRCEQHATLLPAVLHLEVKKSRSAATCRLSSETGLCAVQSDSPASQVVMQSDPKVRDLHPSLATQGMACWAVSA